MKLWTALGIGLLLLGYSANAASRQADDYFFVRDRGQIASLVSPDDIRRVPETFQGKLIEVRGSVLAQVESAFVVRISEQKELTINLPPGKRINEYPVLSINFSIRVLCRVAQEAGQPPAAELVIAVREAEAAAMDAERERIRKAAESRANRIEPRTPGRGGTAEASESPEFKKTRYSTDVVVSKYSDALRYFFAKLTETEARKIAKTLIDVSNKKRVDGRLMMSMLEVEASPNRLAIKNGQPQLYGKPLNGVITEWAALVTKGTRGKEPTEKNLRQVLLTRGQYLARTGRSRKKPVDYALTVVRLYWQMLPEAERNAWTPGEFDLEERWRNRGWATKMPSRLRGAWSGLGGAMLAVINSNGTGVFGTLGGDRGQWREARGYLEFRRKGQLQFRGKYRVSDDGKALTLIRMDVDGTEGADVTFLKQ